METRFGPEVAKAMKEMATDGETMFVFDVDENGEIDGEPCRDWLASEFVEAGYGVNTPCVLRFPDGRAEFGNRVAITAEGLKFLKVEMEAGRF